MARKQEIIRIDIDRAYALLERVEELTPKTEGWKGLLTGRKARRELAEVLDELQFVVAGIEI